jgi:hypothetical protein
MPTYYNGKEITSTSIISGLSLVGKSSINFSGRVISLDVPPPPPRLEMVTLYFAGERVLDPNGACSIGMGGEEMILFSDFSYANTGSTLFEDSEGTIVFDGRGYFYFDPQQNAVVVVDSNGIISPPFPCKKL